MRLHWAQSREKSSRLSPPDLQYHLAILWFKKGSPNRDHRCGVLPVHRQQYSGLGCPLAGINCIWNLVPGPIPATHQCPGASSHMAWPKSFQPESGECKGCCSHVRQHVSGCLLDKSGGGGTKSLPMSDLATDICLWAEKRGMTLIPRHLPGHLNVLADHLSRRGQILKTEWSLSQTIADRISPGWPNQEWFPNLLDFTIDFPITLPPVQKLLKQTFSHQFHPYPWNLNLHAWRLSKDSTRREDFLKRLPKGSRYLRDNPERGFTNLSGRCSESGAMLNK